jgi:hypothetical protein
MLRFKELCEASYAGNIGIMELVKFHKIATPDQKKKLQSHIDNKRHKEAWNFIQKTTGVKLHKSVMEQQEFKSKAGAGEDGSDELVKKYTEDTPGQKIKTFKQYRS